jgi:hypothetical protein
MGAFESKQPKKDESLSRIYRGNNYGTMAGSHDVSRNTTCSNGYEQIPTNDKIDDNKTQTNKKISNIITYNL